jgi:hypothetical protein
VVVLLHLTLPKFQRNRAREGGEETFRKTKLLPKDFNRRTEERERGDRNKLTQDELMSSAVSSMLQCLRYYCGCGCVWLCSQKRMDER